MGAATAARSTRTKQARHRSSRGPCIAQDTPGPAATYGARTPTAQGQMLRPKWCDSSWHCPAPARPELAGAEPVPETSLRSRPQRWSDHRLGERADLRGRGGCAPAVRVAAVMPIDSPRDQPKDLPLKSAAQSKVRCALTGILPLRRARPSPAPDAPPGTVAGPPGWPGHTAS